jgi:hypothetical protein
MSKEYEVGYKRPPRKHQFKPGNQAARKNKGRKKKRKANMADAIDKALMTKRKITKGGQEMTMSISEIVVERLIQLALSGDSRDLARFIEITQKHAPETREEMQDELEVTYHNADGSEIELPDEKQWGTKS